MVSEEDDAECRVAHLHYGLAFVRDADVPAEAASLRHGGLKVLGLI